MDIENYGIGFIDITGVLVFLAVKYGHIVISRYIKIYGYGKHC